MELHWDAPNVNTPYREGITYTVFQGATQVQTGVSETAYTVSGLTNGDKYTFTVRANKEGYEQSAASNAIAVTPLNLTPTSLSVIADNQQAHLSWAASSDAASTDGITYTVFKYGQAIVGATNIEGSAYTVSSLTNGETYAFTVRADKEGYKQSAASSPIAATPLDLTPQSLTAVVDDGAVELRWDAPGSGAEYSEITYTLYQDTQSIQSTANLEGMVITANSTRVTGLTNNTAYYFVVTAKKANYAESGLSNQVDATPDNLTPQGVTATAGNQRVRLDWDAVDGASTYTVYQTVNGEPITKTTHTNAFVATDLNNGTPYGFSITAHKDGFKESAKSAAVLATPLDLAPTSLNVIADNQQAHLSWAASDDAVSTTGITYTVFKNGESITDATNIEALTHTVSNLTNGNNYTFTVRANKEGYEQSTASNAATATPRNFTPQNLTATAGNRTVRLVWDRIAGASQYTVYQTANGNTTTDTANVNAFTANDLINGTEYAFAVTAHVPGYNESAKSDDQTATPLTPAPVNLAFVGGQASIIGVWDVVEGATGYTVHYATQRFTDIPHSLANGGSVETTNTANNEIAISSLTIDETYYITVVTHMTGHADSAPSTSVSAIPQQYPPADTPTNVEATEDQGVITITWQGDADMQYTIHQAEEPLIGNPNNYSASNGYKAHGNATSPHTINEDSNGNPLDNGQSYYFRVTADGDQLSQSLPSEQVHVIVMRGALLNVAQPLGQSANGRGAFVGGICTDGFAGLYEYDHAALNTNATLVEVLGGHTDWVMASVYQANGLILTAGFDGDIQMWNSDDDPTLPADMRIASPHNSWVSALAMDADSTRIASGSGAGTMAVHGSDGVAIVEPFAAHDGAIHALAFHGDATLASGGHDGHVQVWDITNSPATTVTALHHDSPVRTLAFSPDGNTLASAGDDDAIQILDITLDTTRSITTGHTAPIRTIAFSPDGAMLASGSQDGSVRLWNVANGQAVHNPITTHNDWVLSITYDNEVISIDSSATVQTATAP